ncbi:hypothetical protein [Lacticaseibacillus jixiensis]|uniref:hypothetical protein n=1 Tax=Lacticaseibacillus jixiensis TaxID=3231926 RepID=UPI0036F37503
MRVLDLLQLLADHPQNTAVRIRCEESVQNIADFTTQTANEQPQLVIHAKTSGKPLKVWEVIMLLDQKTWRQHYVYVQEGAALRPLFGVQERAGQLIIN